MGIVDPWQLPARYPSTLLARTYARTDWDTLSVPLSVALHLAISWTTSLKHDTSIFEIRLSTGKIIGCFIRAAIIYWGSLTENIQERRLRTALMSLI